MLFYVRCPSCGRVISKNIGKFYEASQTINNDQKMTKKQKENAFSTLIMKYKGICCRSRIMGLIPYHEIVQS